MHLITILVALWLHGRIDGHAPWRDEQRQLGSLGRLHGRLAEARIWDGPVGLILVMLPPVALVALAQWLLDGILMGIPQLGLGLVLLLWALGEGRIDRSLERLDQALARGEGVAAAREAGRLAPGVVVPRDVDGQVRTALAGAFQRAGDTVFAPVFWFLVLGPVGIVLYRVSYLAWRYGARAANPGPRFRRSARRVFVVLAWIPARLTALALGLAGSLSDAWRGWQLARATEGDSHRAVLWGAGFGALRFPEHGGALDEPERWVKEARQLLFRTLVVWLVAIALLTLTGWLA